MANATFFIASKKRNSTRRPDASSGTVVDVKLKDGTDLISPVFLMNNSGVPNWTEVMFEGRYYFIDSIRSIRQDLWEVVCSVDALATYKTQIGSQSLYITRSSAAADGTIIDPLYPTKSGFTYSMTRDADIYDAKNFTGGTYVMGIIGPNSSGGVGATTYYAFTPETFRAVLGRLMGDISFYGVSGSEVSQDLQKMLYNPFQYIASCIWFPFNINKFSGSDQSIQYGWWDLGAVYYGKRLSSVAPIEFSRTLDAPTHPQAVARGAYLNSAPYTRRFVRVMPFGIVEIEPQAYGTGTDIKLAISADVVTGAGLLKIYRTRNNITTETQILQGQIGVSIQLSQMNYDYAAQLSAKNAPLQVAGTIASAITHPISGGLNAAVAYNNSVAAADLAEVPVLQSNGINGGCAGLTALQGGDVVAFHQFLNIVDADNARNGRPLCAIRNIAQLGGFMICSSADFDLAATDTERAQVKSLMESGFYYE